MSHTQEYCISTAYMLLYTDDKLSYYFAKLSPKKFGYVDFFSYIYI